MTVRLPNPRGTAAVAAPTRPDGRPYQFEMLTDGDGWRVYADEPAELVGELIDGYAGMLSPVDRAEARVRFAVAVQVRVQAALVAERGLDGCSDDEQALLLAARDEPPAVARWSAPVPLVLVSSFYQPVQHRPRPQADGGGEIWWIDPADDVSLLSGLHQLGVVTVHVAAPPAAPNGA